MLKKYYLKIKDYLATYKGQQIVSRFQSFLWRLGWMILTAIISWLLLMITKWNIPGDIQILLGLILGEISKYINDSKKLLED